MNRTGLVALLLLPACASSTAQAPKVTAPAPAGIDVAILDRAADPCVDFYQYACGGWLARTSIPPDRPTWSRSFSEIQERNQQALKAILEDYAAGQKLDEVPEAKKLGDYYAACMDEPGIEARGLKPLEPELARLRVKDAASLEQALAHLQRQGVNALFRLGEDQDAQDATLVIAYVTQGGMGLPDRDHYLREDPRSQQLRQQYLEHVQRMLALSGLDPEQAAQGAQTVLRIEKALAEAALSRVDRRDPRKTYHRLELEGLIKTAPHFPWPAFFADLGHGDVRAINVAEPAFFARVDELVQHTPPADWNVYLRWRLLDMAAPALSRPFVDEDFGFTNATLTGVTQILPRWKRCVASTDKNLGYALAHAFVKRTFPPQSKATALELVQAIEAQFGSDVGELAWMDEPTKARAREKLAALANQIGYPESWRSYEALEVGRQDFLRDAFAGRAFDLDYELNKVGKPVDRAEFEMTPPTVNAYYSDSRNQMVFLAGVLQPPFFAPESAPAVNFGAIGLVMGHELTHGFDDKGRQFDAQGNLREWWSPQAGAEFTQRASCVQRQYDGYLAVDDAHVNGSLTLGENIADLGGMKLAYRAMKAHEAQHPSAPAGLSPEQAFFVSEAQIWCRKDREPYLRLLVATDPHSPARWRVIGPMSNMKEFGEAWHCPAGAPMVRPPEQRCEVW